MPEAPYTKYRNYQFNGPNDSSDYNAQVEERYKDLVVLYNQLNQVSETSNTGFKTAVKDLLGIVHKVDDLEARISALESEIISSYISFRGAAAIIDNTRFESTAYSVAEVDRLADNRNYPGLFLPPAGATASFQSAVVLNADTVYVPDSVETAVDGTVGTADTIGSVIDTTQPELSFGRMRGPNWERNVITTSVDADGAQMTLYVRVPPDVSPNAKCNYVMVQPYPVYSVDIIDVSVSTKADVILEEADNYIPLNNKDLYEGEAGALGITPPGGWNGDVDILAGNRLWIFDPREVTALRIKFKQRNYYVENGNYVYTYGANLIDIGYLKTLDTGRAMVRFTPPAGYTVSDISNVTPQIYNISPAYLPDVFSYRVVWETATNSGIYTEDPVAFSNKAWIEVTLKKAPDGTIPLLSGLLVEAS